MDKKGIGIFLGFVLVVSAVVQALCILVPQVSMMYYALLLAPPAGAFLARRLSPAPGYAAPEILDIPRGLALRLALITPLIFAGIYLAGTILGFSRPDWRMGELMAQIQSANELSLPLHLRLVYPLLIFVIGMVITTALGPTLHAIALLGIEYGWRGYLLPRLMPLGRWQAYVLSAVLWAVTFVPYSAIISGRFVMLAPSFVTAVAIGVLLARLYDKTKHAGLCAIAAGAMAVQFIGMWQFLFPEALVKIPLGGATGFVGAVVWVVVAAFPEAVFGRFTPPQPVLTSSVAGAGAGAAVSKTAAETGGE